MRRTNPLLEEAIVRAVHAHPELPKEEVGAALGVVDRTTVYRIVERHATLADETRGVSMDYLRGLWRYFALTTFNAYQIADAQSELSAQNRKDFGLAMAIATDKIALLLGMPTAIVAHHELRPQLREITGKLVELGRRLGAGADAEAAVLLRASESEVVDSIG